MAKTKKLFDLLKVIITSYALLLLKIQDLIAK
jgi:hypothetical protein